MNTIIYNKNDIFNLVVTIKFIEKLFIEYFYMLCRGNIDLTFVTSRIGVYLICTRAASVSRSHEAHLGASDEKSERYLVD